jgi:hypothetical protein
MPERVTLDLQDIAHLMAGGTIVLEARGLELVPGQDIFRSAQRVQTRVNGSRRTLGERRKGITRGEGESR